LEQVFPDKGMPVELVMQTTVLVVEVVPVVPVELVTHLLIQAQVVMVEQVKQVL
jgi:hypothetical protein